MKWWASVSAMELRKILAYRSDFWVTFLGQTFIQLFIARALWQNIFETRGTHQMEGLTLDTMTLYYLIVPLGMKMLSGENMGFISREIYDGTFNRYLIYPLSVFQYKAITYLTHSLFYGCQLILLYCLYHLFFVDGTLGNPLNVLSGVCFFLLSSTLYLMMAIMVELLALWADNIWSLMVMLRFFTSFFGGGFIPLIFFPLWSLAILKWTPFPYIVGLPIRMTMGLATANEILLGTGVIIIWSLILIFVIKFIWSKGQKRYSGVGI